MGISLDTINAAFHSIEIQDASGQPLAIDGSGFITTNVNGTVTVSATDLDIRDLTSASDSVEIKTAAGQALTIDGSGFITANQGTSPWVVSATDLDIRDLVFATDKVDVSGSSVTTVPGGFASWATKNVAVTTTVGQLDATPLAGRLSVVIQNLGANDVYVGPSNAVTAANGLLIGKGNSQEVMLDDGAAIWAITASSTANIRLAEYAA